MSSASIRTIAVNEGYCVTGSDDTFLRVWPLDFSDYILEAQHEGPVLSVNVSQDGLKLAVGTSNGTVGILNIETHAYNNLLRSHADTVYALAVDPCLARNDFGKGGGREAKVGRRWEAWILIPFFHCSPLYTPVHPCKPL